MAGNPKLADFSTADLLEELTHTKQELDALTAEFKEKVAPSEKMRSVLEAELMLRLADENMVTFNVADVGKFTRVLKTTYSVNDPIAFNDFVVSEGDISYLNKTPSSKAVAAYRETHGELPPGVTAAQVYTSRFTPSKK